MGTKVDKLHPSIPGVTELFLHPIPVGMRALAGYHVFDTGTGRSFHHRLIDWITKPIPNSRIIPLFCYIFHHMLQCVDVLPLSENIKKNNNKTTNTAQDVTPVNGCMRSSPLCGRRLRKQCARERANVRPSEAAKQLLHHPGHCVSVLPCAVCLLGTRTRNT